MGESLRYQGVVRKAIKEVKFRGSHDIIKELVVIWNPYFSERYREFRDQVIVSAVPMWWQKERVRGFNQAALIAKLVALEWRVAYGELLMRTRDTKPMYGLDRKNREKNVSNAFALNTKIQRSHNKHRVVILIDDVWTSGATMRECARVLRGNGVAEVRTITLAR